tara:strand:- start:217 stop:1380 length:1164 start_codon:yes stop_codon:yes gene_type:complete
MEKQKLTLQIKDKAVGLGFNSVGISPASEIEGTQLQLWLNRQYHGQMSYMERNSEKRKDPSRVLPSARSIISVSLNYFHPYDLPYNSSERGVFSRYASGDDYHDVLRKKLEQLLEHIRLLIPKVEGKIYVDTGPMMDKYWAAQSGIGWLGKHTNLLSRESGSWFFLGEILVSVALEYDSPGEDFCGTCTRCIDACPTDAIVQPYVLDSRRCISYLTIELRDDIPEEFRSSMSNLIFGCDICQDVCPWNQEIPHSTVKEFEAREFNRAPFLRELANITLKEFQERFHGSPVKRTKWRGFLRNVAIAMGNSGNPEMVLELKKLLNYEDPLIRRHAAWALNQIDSLEARQAILTRLEKEEDRNTLRTLNGLAKTFCRDQEINNEEDISKE